MSESRTIPPLRIAVLGDFEGMHTRRWVEVFVQRGHEVHAISYYRPTTTIEGVETHVLSGDATDAGGRALSTGERRGQRGAARTLRGLLPPSMERAIHALRYTRAGLRRVLQEIQPDVFHAHYAVEHGFYGAFAGFHPYVVSAWGSDLLVESHKPLGRLIAQYALGKADLVTANDVSLARRAIELGVPEDNTEVVHLGIDRVFLEAGEGSINLGTGSDVVPTLISTRALEPLYNVDVVIRAFARLRERLPAARLIVAHEGSQAPALRKLAEELVPGGVTFTGRLTATELAGALANAHAYVSVPSSDSFALSTVEAMAAGCFPIVSDLPSIEGWLKHGSTALFVPARDTTALTEAMSRALTDATLRQAAAGANRTQAEHRGLRERNMLLMEKHYYRLAGHPQAGGGESI